MSKPLKKAIIKCISYGVLAVVLLVLQSARTPGLTLFGATPNVMPFLVAALGLYESPYMAGGFGFFAGQLLSVHSHTVEGLACLLLSLFGVVFGYLSEKYFRNSIVLPIVGGTLCLTIGEVCKYIFYYMLVYGVSIGTGALTLLGALVLSVPGGVAVCFAVKLLARAFSEVEK